MQTSTLIHFGGSVKVLETKGDLVTVGGPGVVFDDPASPVKDLTGDYFTRESYFGALKGNGVDCAFHHGFPIEGKTTFAKHLSEYFFPPVKSEMTESEIVASVILDKRKEYERFAYEQAAKGLLSWSSGAVGHLVKRAEDGWLKCWPIGEWSLTPTPAEPRTTAIPIKSLLERSTDRSIPGNPFKAESLNQRLERFYQAWREAYPEDGWLADAWPEEGYVVANFRGRFYQVPFTMEDDTIRFADPTEWEKVRERREWEMVKTLYDQITKSATPNGSISRSGLTDLASALEMHNLNLKAHTLIGG